MLMISDGSLSVIDVYFNIQKPDYSQVKAERA